MIHEADTEHCDLRGYQTLPLVIEHVVIEASFDRRSVTQTATITSLHRLTQHMSA